MTKFQKFFKKIFDDKSLSNFLKNLKIFCKKKVFPYTKRKTMNEALFHISETIKNLENNLKSVIIGQDDLIRKLIITIFSGGHALIE